ncbi:hypothetical protein HHI36_003004 [Cryptolaemus montrouzieri]|uniref:Uncharacterized protein n=1 Tax=Cryptolaemus montrouzieri TaxID=559131 RepID=A0ABD2PCN4_9CUCU
MNSPIKIEFVSYSTKREILSRGIKLKGTGVVISHDLTQQPRKEISILRKHMKKARTSGKQIYIKRDRLVIDNKQFTVGELEEREIESEDDNLGEKTTKPRDTKETTGSRGQAEGKNQFKYNIRIGAKNLKIDPNLK